MVRNPIIQLNIKQFPYVKLLLFYMLGICLGRVFSESIRNLLIVEIVLISCLLIYFLCFFLSRIDIAKHTSTILLYILFLNFGFYQCIKNELQFQPDYFTNFSVPQYVVVVMDEPVEKEKTIRFPVDVLMAVDSMTAKPVVGKVMITLLKDSSIRNSINYGDQMMLRNKITPIKPPYNPSQFDYQSFLKNKDIWHQSLINSADFKILDQGKGNRVLDFSLRLRKQLVDKYKLYIADERAFQISSALIFGYRAAMDQEVISSFSKTGTIHVLSVSGLHVTIVFVLLNFLLQWLDRYPNGRVFRFCFVLTSIWFYVVFTGMAPPMLRAGVMISFFIVGQWANRQQSPFNALAASAFLLLLMNPKMLFDMGFQLSYLAMLGLGTYLKLFQKLYNPKNELLKNIITVGYVSIAAQVTTLPLVLYYFGQFPNYFLLANYLITIPTLLMMYAGLFLAILPIHIASEWLGKFLNYLIEFTYQGLASIADLPNSTLAGVYINHYQVLLLFLAIIFFFIAWNYGSKLSLANSAICLIIFLIFMQYQQQTKYQFDGIKFYNVNQQIAIARIKNNQVLLLSSLDSLQHSTIQFNVIPDLLSYSPSDQIQFQHLSAIRRTNFMLQFDDVSIALIEGYVGSELLDKANIVLWRKNNRENLLKIINRYPYPLVLLDGSNSDSYLNEITVPLEEKQIPYYILKNNYAYVWDKVLEE